MISFATPLNLSLFAILVTFFYFRFVRPYSGTQSYLTLDKDKAVVFSTFTPRTLLKFNGLPSEPFNPEGKVYIAVKGKVHDVTSGRNFYGPGGPYENFAGRDATRGLACQSFDEDMLTKDLDGPLDDCKDLGATELENLQGWVERFDEKVSLILSAIRSHCSLMAWTILLTDIIVPGGWKVGVVQQAPCVRRMMNERDGI